MNQLGVLLRYKLKMWSNIPKRRGRRGMPIFVYILILGGVFAFIGVPAYSLFVGIFKDYSTVVFNGISLADIFVEISMIGILVLVLVTDTPAVALNVFMSEDVDFLLSLPISQSTIFTSKAIETMIQGGFPALFVIPILAAYANATKMPWYAIIFMFVMYMFYFLILTAISSLIALGISKFASRSGTQRFMLLTSLIVYVFALLSMSMIGSLNSNAENVEMAFSNYVSTINAPYLPSTWFLDALKLQWSGILLMIGTSIVLSIVTYLVASNGILTGFSKMISAKKRTILKKNYKVRGPIIAFVLKDVKLMRREPSILFLLIYPAALPLILAGFGVMRNGNITTQEIMIPVVSVFLSSMYTVIATASLVSMEIKVGDFVNTLPIDKKTPLWSKAFVITSAFTVIMMVTFSILSVISNNVLLPILTLFFSIPILLILSFFGVYVTIKWPSSTGGIRRPLNTTGTLISMGIGILGAIIANSEGIYFADNQVLSFLQPILRFFVFFVIPALVEIIMAIVTFKLLSKIDWTKPYEIKKKGD